jgi:hypothetical protein
MRGTVVAAAVVLMAFVGAARAEDKDKAREAYQAADKHYDLGEYKEALEGFKDAYRNFSDPTILFNIAQCHRQLGESAEAIRQYRMYLIKVPDAANRDEVKALIGKLEAAIKKDDAAKAAPPQGSLTPPPAIAAKPLLGRLRVTTVPDGATVRFDDDKKSQAGTTPVEFSELSPGTRRVFITKEGYGTIERNVDITAGGSAVVDLQLTPSVATTPDVAASVQATPSEEQHDEKPVYKKWWFWAAVGAVAVVGVGVGLGVGLSSGPTAPSASTSTGTFRF